MDKQIKYENYVKRNPLITNKHRLAYMRNKDFKNLFCKSIKIKAKVLLKHCKREYFGYSISNYRKKYVNNECIEDIILKDINKKISIVCENLKWK